MSSETLLKLIMFYYEHETLFKSKYMQLSEFIDKYKKLYNEHCLGENDG